MMHTYGIYMFVVIVAFVAAFAWTVRAIDKLEDQEPLVKDEEPSEHHQAIMALSKQISEDLYTPNVTFTIPPIATGPHRIYFNGTDTGVDTQVNGPSVFDNPDLASTQTEKPKKKAKKKKKTKKRTTKSK